MIRMSSVASKRSSGALRHQYSRSSEGSNKETTENWVLSMRREYKRSRLMGISEGHLARIPVQLRLIIHQYSSIDPLHALNTRTLLDSILLVRHCLSVISRWFQCRS